MKLRAKRDFFAELSEGMDALADARRGKRTLRTHSMEFKPAPTLTPKELIRVRKKLKLSRALFAIYLRKKRAHTGKLGTGSRQAECASCPID